MKLRYHSLARTGELYRVGVIATSRSGATQALVASGKTPREAHDAVDRKVDAIAPEWWRS